MLRLLVVTENSMAPAYEEGDFVLVGKIPFLFSVTAGDVVVLRRQPYGTLIKRVQATSPNGQFVTVLGTHPNSVDSRTFGPVGLHEIVGKVLWHVKRRP
ncbi:MAG: S26 family signal peptidase [Chloroflexota bacterium]